MRFLVITLFAFILLDPLWGDENALEEVLKALLDEALRINIVARILPPGQEPVFNVERSKLTLPGLPVALRFQGKNILIIANLTPYKRKNGNLILVAQGQIWLQDSSSRKAMTFRSSLKSLPVSLGEKVLFLPLGVAEDLESENSFNIELEIEIVPFRSS